MIVNPFRFGLPAPTLFAEGSTLLVTSGTLSPTIPTHAANDILVLTVECWLPATAGDAAEIPTPSGWALVGTQIGQPAGTRDGWLATFWLRASGAGTTVTLTRGASWDDGIDGSYSARAYVIRGCVTSGDPWDAAAQSGPHTASNQAFPAVTVSGSARLVVQFGASMDNASLAMNSTGWTAGIEDDDAGGTDSAFQTALKDNVSSSTSADTATVAAPAQGAYGFYGISFKP
jgi:hypothetical protein